MYEVKFGSPFNLWVERSSYLFFWRRWCKLYIFKLSYFHSCYSRQAKGFKENRSIEENFSVTLHKSVGSKKQQSCSLLATLHPVRCTMTSFALPQTKKKNLFFLVCLKTVYKSSSTLEFFSKSQVTELKTS